eukprot:TRINITY_DN32717_c0_g1_i1.p1 TRINITY_DN32717_c0_g1~~TRINITY_DN32717_c0_g1_i1.p1  ORF type:complete len:190 (+),score=1.76 TRINITY_DN32717_c0_g1_i1:448-1017(+)
MSQPRMWLDVHEHYNLLADLNAGWDRMHNTYKFYLLGEMHRDYANEEDEHIPTQMLFARTAGLTEKVVMGLHADHSRARGSAEGVLRRCTWAPLVVTICKLLKEKVSTKKRSYASDQVGPSSAIYEKDWHSSHSCAASVMEALQATVDKAKRFPHHQTHNEKLLAGITFTKGLIDEDGNERDAQGNIIG